MKKIVALSVAALVVAACSEPTTPKTFDSSDLAPVFAKKTPLPAPDQPTVCPAGPVCNDFEGVGASSDDIGITGEAIVTSPNSTTHYLGLKSGAQTYVMNQPAGGSVVLTFNLYIIGNWLGDQKKIPDHSWQLASQCGTGAETLLVDATFSNRVGNYQSFPEDRFEGHHGGLYAATGKDVLGFRGTGIAHPGGAADAADARYAIQRTIAACGSARTITFRGKDITADQIWGIDNVTLQ